jgi:AraC-like DNA-binding protein/quercetin dioxygenase-like cupin family protein
VSPEGHRPEDDRNCAGARPDDAPAVQVATFPMPAGFVFDWHTHTDHQLAWAASGVLTVLTDTATWVLPPTRALWIPAGLRHETRSSGTAVMRSAYLSPAQCPVSWPEPTPVAATRLLAELVGYLEGDDLAADQRAHAEAVLAGLLEPVTMATIELRFPPPGPARQVAQALAANPDDHRTLEQWGQLAGASGRSLARGFVAGTGLTFGRWRVLARLQAALPALAAGHPISGVARRAGYESASAFVAAFRRETGITPAAYFADLPGPAGPPGPPGPPAA